MGNPTLGINKEKVRKSIEGIENAVCDFTINVAKKNQSSIIDVLCEGYVTPDGKRFIEGLGTDLFNLNKKLYETAKSIVLQIESAAADVSKALSDPYVPKGSDISYVGFDTSNAKRNVDGTTYILSENLKSAHVALKNLVNISIPMCFSNVMAAAYDCGLYDSNALMNQSLHRLLEEWRDTYSEKVNSLASSVMAVLDSTNEEVIDALKRGNAALEIAQNLNSD